MCKKLITSIFTFFLFASLSASVESDFMQQAMEKIEKEVMESSSFNEKALCFQNLEKWFQLLAKLDISTKEKLRILSDTKSSIDNLREEFQVFPEHFFANEETKVISVIYKGQPTVAFVNLDEKRYDGEVESYKKHKSFKPIVVHSLKDLRSGVHYNWVLTLDGKFICGELQEYDDIFTKGSDEEKKKILLAPNHAILAKGEPVISAGEIKIIGDINKCPICWVAMTSGHYHPSLESRSHIENKLQEFVLPQQIVTLGFHLYKLPWKFLQESVEK